MCSFAKVLCMTHPKHLCGYYQKFFLIGINKGENLGFSLPIARFPVACRLTFSFSRWVSEPRFHR